MGVPGRGGERGGRRLSGFRPRSVPPPSWEPRVTGSGGGFRMGDKPIWEQIGSSFVQHYYRIFDTDRTHLGSLYSLPFQKIQHSITSQDHQPTPDSCILSMVVGQLKADEDPIIGFHQIFILKNINDAWVCTNDMFRLALHNYG
ncbi:nuclear transport factor 2 isoform X5 [Chelonia mydas]|uniref:nuclear transport factor 2 isoform X5 n=2 Tax=Cheloniidae TaxID=8465 RepID=UPI0018A1EEBF|nr:nuclear transport factor 2 isoform X5 [Chelonia mydas]